MNTQKIGSNLFRAISHCLSLSLSELLAIGQMFLQHAIIMRPFNGCMCLSVVEMQSPCSNVTLYNDSDLKSHETTLIVTTTTTIPKLLVVQIINVNVYINNSSTFHPKLCTVPAHCSVKSVFIISSIARIYVAAISVLMSGSEYI